MNFKKHFYQLIRLTFSLFCCVCCLRPNSVQAINVQPELKNVFIKWINAEKSCFELEDHKLNPEDLPDFKTDDQGYYYIIELNLKKTQKNCSLQGWNPSNTVESVQELGEGQFVVVLKLRPPVDKLYFQDTTSKGMLLVEAESSEFWAHEQQNKFFERTVIAVQGGALNSKLWQLFFMRAQVQVQGLWLKNFGVQIGVGQSIGDFLKTGLGQGTYDFGVAWSLVGEGPFETPYDVTFRTFFEGRQHSDNNRTEAYPLLVSQMFGVGVDVDVRLSPLWGLRSSIETLGFIKQNLRLYKANAHGLVSLRLSPTWRLELGAGYAPMWFQNLLNVEAQKSFREIFIHGGVRVTAF